MRSLDDELRDALRPESPPDGFVDRVLARLPAEAPRPAPKPAPWRPVTRAWWVGIAAAAALAVASGGVWIAAPRAPEPQQVGSVVIPPPEPGVTPPAPAPKIDPPPPETNRSADPRPAPRKFRAPRPARESLEAVRAAETLRTALQLTSGTLRHAQRETREALFAPES